MTLPKRLYQQIADQVRHLIQSGPYPAGRGCHLNVSWRKPWGLTTVLARGVDCAGNRRNNRDLHGIGHLCPVCQQVRRLWAITGESPTELMQARAVIESAVIVKAAAAMTDAVFAALVRIVESMRQEIAGGRKPIDQDRQFHLTIAEQSGNSVLAEIVANLFDERHSPISDHIRGRFETPETWSLALIEHEAILTALEARDPLAAQAAMYAHLTASRRRWLEN